MSTQTRPPDEPPPLPLRTGAATGAPDDVEMTFTEHLAELRRRLIVAVIAVGVAALAAFPAMPYVLTFVERAFLPGITLHVFSPAETIRVYIKLSVLLGLVVAMPVVLYEAYAFIAPAIDRRLRKRVVWYAVPSFVMSAAGIAFCGFFILPWVIRALIRINESAGLVGTYQLEPTIGFIAVLLGIFAVMFQLPIVLALLASVGIVNAKMLAGKWRHATIIIFIAAGIAAPDGNPMTMALLALPLLVLYLASIVVVRFTEPKVAYPRARV